MRKILKITFLIFFNIIAIGMEKPRENTYTQTSIPSQLHFDHLSDELILYIFSFLVSKEPELLKTITNIFKNLTNLKRVNRRSYRIASDDSISVLIKNLINQLINSEPFNFSKNKEILKKELLRIFENKEMSKKDIFLLKVLLYFLKQKSYVWRIRWEGFKNKALMHAIKNNDKETVKLLLNFITSFFLDGLINTLTLIDGGNTILRDVCICNKIELGKLIFGYISQFYENKQIRIRDSLSASDKKQEQITEILEDNALIDQTKQTDIINDQHLLFCAIRNNNKEIIELILNFIKNFELSKQRKIINPNYRTSALITAVQYTDKPIVLSILNFINKFKPKKQVKILKLKDNGGNNALISAKPHILKILLNFISKFKLKKQLRIINAKNIVQNTVLFSATKANNKKIAKLILNYITKFSADEQFEIINVKQDRGFTPLIEAAENNNKDMISLLFNCISKLEPDKQLRIVNTCTSNGTTALIEATKNNDTDSISLIMNCIIKLDSNDEQLKSIIALFSRATFKKEKTLKLILNFISKLESKKQIQIFKAEDESGQTNLMHIFNRNTAKIFDSVLNFISNFNLDMQLKIINSKDNKGDTILIITVLWYKELRAVLNFISNFAIGKQFKILNTKNDKGETVFTSAAKERAIPSLKLILNFINRFKTNEQITIINACDNLGYTAKDSLVSYECVIKNSVVKKSYTNLIKTIDAINRKKNDAEIMRLLDKIIS